MKIAAHIALRNLQKGIDLSCVLDRQTDKHTKNDSARLVSNFLFVL